ncbi:MAG: hypothetical protein NPIRA02_11910 [Nitrospirales bacterium]|nr:MAG: hypothetical protein NPIRA02_11910 [Nitrospirales bacterium]
MLRVLGIYEACSKNEGHLYKLGFLCECKEAARGTWAPVIVLVEKRIYPNKGKMAVPSALWSIVPKATALSLGYDRGTAR